MIVRFEKQVFDLDDREQRIDYAIKRWTPMINNMAGKFRNPVCDKEDLAQEARLRVVHAADLWNPDHDSGTSWETYAFRAIKNAIIDAAVRSSYAMAIPSGSMSSVNLNAMRAAKLTDEVPDDRGDPYEFLDLLDTLEEFDHYRVGELYFVERRTINEISELTGISRSKVGRTISRMKELLQARLAV